MSRPFPGSCAALRYLLPLLGAAVLAGPGAAENAAGPAVEGPPLLAHAKRLSSDDWAGRASGTDGEKAATRYIATQFGKIGLEPAGDDGTWFQAVPMFGPFTIGDDTSLVVRAGEDGARTLEFAPARDFRPFSSSATAVAEAPLVFAGYGIAAGELYDDYRGLDVKGRIVVVLRGAPRVPGWSGNRRVRRGAPFTEKLKAAAARGAVGLILVNDPATFGKGAKRPDALFRRPIPGDAAIPYVHMKRAAGRKLCAAAFGAPVEELEAAVLEGRGNEAGAPRPASRASDVRARLAAEVRRKKLRGRNVCGLLRAGAADAVDEFVVVGAHHDHLGRGRPGSLARSKTEREKIHNGADDNASGTAACIEAARALARLRGRLRRSILFLTFTGEEMGLLGSQYYVEHPRVPLKNTVAMINMDMIGRRDGRPVFVGGVKTSPSWAPILKRRTGELGLEVQFGAGGLAPSDNTSFYRKRMPVLFFFTGLHRDYHRPSDDWPKLDVASMAKIATLCARTAFDVANLDERPKFTRADRGGGGPPRPVLGINVARGEGGVRVAAVRPNGPAAAAGLRAGDVIEALAGKRTPDVARLRAVMRTLRIGQEVELRVRRGANELEIGLQLGRG